jgi:hypothetical protein
MFRMKILATSALVGALATTGYAAVERIAKIDVTNDLSAIQNPAAATYWANLEADLESAIAARVTERLVSEEDSLTTSDGTEDGAKIIDGTQIIIDIREVELSSAFERKLNLADAVLVGQVNIKDDSDNSNFDAYELSVSLESANVVVPEGMTLVLSTDTAESYDKLVQAFAEGVVSRLK